MKYEWIESLKSLIWDFVSIIILLIFLPYLLYLIYFKGEIKGEKEDEE